jgi:Domain of unknown function (DUF6899)
MPYIDAARRLDLDLGAGPQTVGELNYKVSRTLQSYLNFKKVWNQGKISYQLINDVVGALESSKLEFYRRLAVPYEETKIKTQGDIY